MNFFITGGAGSIGSYLAEYLVGRGDSVTVYDNFSSGRRSFIKDLTGESNFSLVKGDLLDRAELEKSLRGHETVFHLAANPDIRGSLTKPELDFEQGTVATFNLLQAMKKTGVKKVVFASSSVVFGLPGVIPTPEDYGPLRPLSLYGASKLACEGLISAWTHCFGFRSWIFRFANVASPRLTHGILFDFTRKLRRDPRKLEVLGDGRQNKSYLWVGDCVEGMVFGLEHSPGNAEIFNLGTRDRMKVAEIARLFLKASGSSAEIVYAGGRQGWPGDVPKMLLDVAKMERLGWRAKYSSREAVEKALGVKQAVGA